MPSMWKSMNETARMGPNEAVRVDCSTRRVICSTVFKLLKVFFLPKPRKFPISAAFLGIPEVHR